VLDTEDAAEYQRLCRQFFVENKPATALETQLIQELADTAWRLNRIPRLEAALLDRAANRHPSKPESTSTSSMPTAPSPLSVLTRSCSPAGSNMP
jgi:hypothetical protein